MNFRENKLEFVKRFELHLSSEKIIRLRDRVTARPLNLEIDIKTRFLPDDHAVYVLFPGDGYRFYADMVRQSVVFMDIPGYPMDSIQELRDADDVVERYIVSDGIASWHRSGRDGDLPPRTVDDLGRIRRTETRRNTSTQVYNFFTRIRPGDVIVVPCQGYEGEVLLGEIASNRIVSANSSYYPDEVIPARRVNWIRKIPSADIPSWLDRKLRIPNPVHLIERESVKYIYDKMYERYYRDEQFYCKFDVTSEEFSSYDNFVFQQIVMYTAALHGLRMEGALDDISKHSIAGLASSIGYSNDIPDQSVEINSPGHIVVYAKNIIPIVVASMIAISATVGVGAQNANIVVTNSVDSSALSQECQVEVAAEVKEDLTAMGYDRWQELCQLEVQARQRSGLEAGVTVAEEPIRLKPSGGPQ
jgi:hypothetical protein